MDCPGAWFTNRPATADRSYDCADIEVLSQNLIRLSEFHGAGTWSWLLVTPEAVTLSDFTMVTAVDISLRSRTMKRLALYFYVAICLAMLGAVSWSLLTPDPFAVVRSSSLAWLEQVSDLLVHAVVFTLLSAAWLGLCLQLAGDLSPFALCIMLGYCVSMEAMQAIVPGRHCDPVDGVANVAGFVFGLMLVRTVGQLRTTRTRLPQLF